MSLSPMPFINQTGFKRVNILLIKCSASLLKKLSFIYYKFEEILEIVELYLIIVLIFLQ